MMDKFVSPEPVPNPHERELLDLLIEECAEVIQRATKMDRFGVLEAQPGHDNNRVRLSLEVGQLFEVIERCRMAEILDSCAVMAGQIEKRGKLRKYMQTEGPGND